MGQRCSQQRFGAKGDFVSAFCTDLCTPDQLKCVGFFHCALSFRALLTLILQQGICDISADLLAASLTLSWQGDMLLLAVPMGTRQ
jgi:hypothetical protein